MKLIRESSVKTVPQDKLAEGEVLRPAPKIFKETCRIDWSKGVKQIYDFVRGLSPYPAAWTELCQGSTAPQVLKIYETDKIFAEHSFEPGTVVTDKKTYFRIAVTDGYINIRSLQLAGKKRMGVADFLRGYHHEDGAVVK